MTYQNEQNANFALFHFTKSVDAIEKMLVEGINQSSTDEIEEFLEKSNVKHSEFSKWYPLLFWQSLLRNSTISKVPPRPLCCSLAISSDIPEDQLKIKFFENSSPLFQGIGIVIEDSNKVLVPHADYFAYNSGGILPPTLTKDQISEEIKYKLIQRDKEKNKEKPVRAGYLGRLHHGVYPITNYASWSREDKKELDNKGGKKGFLNFAKNFYRTSLYGASKHKNTLKIRTKYYPRDSSSGQRPTANYTEVMVYQEEGKENPVTGVVLNMQSLACQPADFDKLKELFNKNPNFALYIYDTNLEANFVRKITDQARIAEYLDFIKSSMQNGKLDYDTNPQKTIIRQLNQSLPALDNKILAPQASLQSGSSPIDSSPAGTLSPESKEKPNINIKEEIKKEFKGFQDGLKTSDSVIDFLKYLWGSNIDIQNYDTVKEKCVERFKDKYIRDQENSVRKLVNEINRELAIQKLSELNSQETDDSKKTSTQEFLNNYRKIYSKHQFDKYLQQDEFEARKTEMLTLTTTKLIPERFKKFEDLETALDSADSKIDDSIILDFLKSLKDTEPEEKSTKDDSNILKKLWKEHQDSMSSYESSHKKVFARDFLLQIINSLKQKETKDKLEQFINTNYQQDNFLNNLADKPNKIQSIPQENQESNTSNYVISGALIGAGAGIGIGAGLCVSALGAGIVLSAPVVATVVVGAVIGIGAGAVIGGVVGQKILENPNGLKLQKTGERSI